MPGFTKEGFRKEVENLNKKVFANLSADEIYARVEEIMKSPEEEWADSFVEYMKELNMVIYEKPSYYRTLVMSNPDRWVKKNVYYQYSIGQATREARHLIRYCRKMINPDSDKTFEYKEKQFAAIRDWHVERLKNFTEYAEMERTWRDWDYKAVKSSFKSLDEKLKLGKKSEADGRHSFSADYTNANDQIIANVYARSQMFKEEIAKHNFLWRWFTFAGRAYTSYVNRSEELFKKVGFNEKIHAEAAINYCKNTLPEVYDTDIGIVKGDYDSQMESYIRDHTPEIFDARDWFKNSAELNLDPEFALESKLAPFAEKYGIDASSLANKRIDWSSPAKWYDTRRDTNPFGSTAKTAFASALGKMIDAAAKKHGADMNIADVLDDVRKVAVISIKFSSIMYDIDTFKNAEKPIYISDDFTPEYIEGRMDYFLKSANLSPEIKEKIAKEAAAHVRSWYDDFDKLKKEDLELASSVTHPEITDISVVERKIINNLLTVGYRPPKRDNSALLDKHTAVIEKMTKEWFSENKRHPEGVKEVFAKNVEKLEALKKIPYRDENAAAKLSEEWDKSDVEMNERYPNYKPETLEDLKNEGAVKYSISVDLEANNENLAKSPIIDDNSAPVKDNIASANK